MATKLIEDDFRYLDLELAVEPFTSTVGVYRDFWWCVHPERGLLCYKTRKTINGFGEWIISPQAAHLQEMADRLCPDFAEVRHLPLVFIPIVVRDYDYYLPERPTKRI